MLSLKCIPCIINQIVRTLDIIDINEDDKIILLKKSLRTLTEEDWSHMPSIIYFEIYRFIRLSAGVYDPYHEIKKIWNRKAREFFDRYRFKMPDNQLYTFLKLSLAANIIDFGALEEFNIEDTIDDVVRQDPMLNDYKYFIERISNSKSLLYLMDNAGEAYFDILLIKKILESYPNIEEIGIGAREEPFINDITLEDLKKEEFIKLLPSSSYELIGLPVSKNKFLEYDKDVFQRMFSSYDVVISKGQGNYELFYKYKNIFFALIIKCKPVSEMFNIPIGNTVFYLNK